jgi:hypothetical protein
MSFIHVDAAQISEEEGRLKKDEEETKDMWKKKREHEEKWEEGRERRVCYLYQLKNQPRIKCHMSTDDTMDLYFVGL